MKFGCSGFHFAGVGEFAILFVGTLRYGMVWAAPSCIFLDNERHSEGLQEGRACYGLAESRSVLV